jgi:hypothetical protein
VALILIIMGALATFLVEVMVVQINFGKNLELRLAYPN